MHVRCRHRHRHRHDRCRFDSKKIFHNTKTTAKQQQNEQNERLVDL